LQLASADADGPGGELGMDGMAVGIDKNSGDFAADAMAAQAPAHLLIGGVEDGGL
jgi:hypothetical protein